jgi:hypothetical protein
MSAQRWLLHRAEICSIALPEALRPWWARLFWRVEHILRSSAGLSPAEVEPRQVEVISPECDPALAEEAIGVGAGMRFRPARVGSTPLPVLITIPITLRFPG